MISPTKIGKLMPNGIVPALSLQTLEKLQHRILLKQRMITVLVSQIDQDLWFIQRKIKRTGSLTTRESLNLMQLQINLK